MQTPAFRPIRALRNEESPRHVRTGMRLGPGQKFLCAPLGHTKLESTVRYLGIEVEDALEIAEQTEV
jgi:hypothetical protein